MSQNVEFILSLEDKQFTASIDRAGKLLTKFGERATKPAQKLKTSSALWVRSPAFLALLKHDSILRQTNYRT